ncbi:hypothetical protein [Gelria sp. Kuro-4]|uniref:hypothetical protein n=1 Tax=Gelria sp. Kuro-4 TaxID=2796927 RepID=UPI001BF010E3|nr:hypothetical protein [Gelria sp. Kuro-4]BCV25031.1 hypothetical protein kuro4_18040 [Gelria sp. Kuro-4]
MQEECAGGVEALHREISGLEARLAGLRLGRRVLMNLIELLEKRRRTEVQQLEREVARLKRRNRALARLLWEKSRLSVEPVEKPARPGSERRAE